MKNLFLYLPLIGLMLLAFLLFAGCDTAGSDSDDLDCESRTGNSMAARVNGEALCTDLGNALLFDIGEPQLSILGLFADGLTSTTGASINFNLKNPGVGTHPLRDAGFGADDESVFYVVDAGADEGSGTVTIIEFSDTRVKGSFEFTAVGIDAITDELNGEEVRVTDGVFDFALVTE
jgi:hypothetical protein